VATHPRYAAGVACLVALAVAGCGGSDDPANEPMPLSVGTGTVATGSKAVGSTYESPNFSFTLPAGWSERPATSAESYGRPASAASVAPDGSAPSTLVLVLAYDIRGQAEESPDGPRAWFDWYARTNDAELTAAPKEISLDGVPGWLGDLTWDDVRGNPVDVTIVRAVDEEILYLIQCQGEPADRAAVEAGCTTIVDSFRAG
jgi:hypothetical protein